MKQTAHTINAVEAGSIAEEMEIEAGDRLLAINGQPIRDVFDYQYLTEDETVSVLIEKPGGEQWLLEIEKEADEDLGLRFANGLMDEYRSCKNRCIFCFIDQMPKGMRETLYFKDDDARLSFLQGNYVTLTNLSWEDVERIIRYRLAPINVSFHTTNPDLRCKMLHNRFAGEALQKAERLYEAGILMNGQIVLCRGINDGEELERTIRDLSRYLPVLQSVSVVPVGLTRHREGLFPLEPFTREDAEKVLDRIEAWQRALLRESGLHWIHASDEWYLLAERPLPEPERYDGYPQLENGVGMLRLLLTEFAEALDPAGAFLQSCPPPSLRRSVSIATGLLAFPYLKEMAERLMARYPHLRVFVYPIRNVFFGEQITVSGLLTGQDIAAQLRGRELGETLLLPQNVLRSGEAVFLDDMTLEQLENALQVPADIVKSSGQDLVRAILGMTGEN